jgi:glycine reductase
LNFLGVIPAVESTVLSGKKRAAMMNVSMAKELGADAVIITEEGYGNPDTDFCLNAKLFEKAGIKAVVISDEAAGTNGASHGIADATPELVSFISTGNVNEMIELPPMQRVIGYVSAIKNLSGGDAESLRKDGSLFVELQAIIGSTSEIGFNTLRCEWI